MYVTFPLGAVQAFNKASFILEHEDMWDAGEILFAKSVVGSFQCAAELFATKVGEGMFVDKVDPFTGFPEYFTLERFTEDDVQMLHLFGKLILADLEGAADGMYS